MFKRIRYSAFLALFLILFMVVSLTRCLFFVREELTKDCRTMDELLSNASVVEEISSCGERYFSKEEVHEGMRNPGCFQFLDLSKDDDFVINKLYKKEIMDKIVFGTNYRYQIILVNNTLMDNFLDNSDKEIRHVGQNVFYRCSLSK